MKRVAVIGGGPAGAYAAELLSGGGVPTVLIDEKLAWEKPCGGGLSYKAYRRYPFLASAVTPNRRVPEIRIGAPRAGLARLPLTNPLVIYARRDLNQLLLTRAERAGAQFEQTRVLSMERRPSGWRIRTATGSIDADACVVATGARNSLRGLGAEFTPDDAMMALGYYVEGDQSHIDIEFLDGLHGYIWIFPRCGHLSAGICGKREASASLRARLEQFLSGRGIAYRGARFYAHLLPALESRSWRGNRVAGDRWLAAGDAAGFVDPVTGEGIYYAIRSGELAARALLDRGPVESANLYRDATGHDFARDLAFGAAMAPRFYRGNFLYGSVTTRMVQFSRRSPAFGAVMQDLFAGAQTYSGLPRRLWRNLLPTLLEVATTPLPHSASA